MRAPPSHCYSPRSWTSSAGTGVHGGRIFLRLLGLGRAEPFHRPTDGPARTPRRPRGGHRGNDGGLAACSTRPPIVASLRHARHARRRRRQLPRVYRARALPTELVRAPAGGLAMSVAFSGVGVGSIVVLPWG